MTANDYMNQARKAIRGSSISVDNGNESYALGEYKKAQDWYECADDFAELAEIYLGRMKAVISLNQLIDEALNENLSKKNES